MLTGKNAVITGTLQGIGKATLEFFVSNGANVWACAQRRSNDFETFCKELEHNNKVWVKPVYFDLTNSNEIKEAVKNIQSDKKPIDSLVNIAGMAKDAIFHMVTMDTLKLVFEINFFSQVLFSQYITKLMMRNTNPSSVIFVSSISALDGNVGQLAYSSSKAALLGATKTMSKELASKGIRVNAVAPGVIDTDMNKVVPLGVIEEKVKVMDIKRLGKPSEVASTIAFLASDLSKHITGQVIRIDGGIK